MAHPAPSQGEERGFSLIETMIAMAVLAAGLLSMAGVFVVGLAQLAGSSASLVAREKAREAVESVHTARDTKTIMWCEIRNVGTPTNCFDNSPGVFLAGAQPMKAPGVDGLVNTADDGPGIETMMSPGKDNIPGTADDVAMPMTNYTRQIAITDILLPNGTPNPILRRLTVTITYRVGRSNRTYTLTTFLSSIS